MTKRLLIFLILFLNSCTFYNDEILTKNFKTIDEKIKDIAIVLHAHDDRLELLYPTKKEQKK